MSRIRINDELEGNYARRYYLRNRELVLRRTRDRQIANPELCREYTRRHRLKKFGPPKIKTPIERFEEKYIPEPNSGCWIWLGTVQKNGYGRFGFNSGRSGFAHRWSYLYFKGEISEGFEIK